MDNLQNINSLFGFARSALAAFQLGSLFTWGLHGVLCVQIYNYYLSFPNDPIFRKLAVYLILAVETVQLVLVTRDAYQLFTVGFGDYLVLDQLQLVPLTVPVLGGLIGLTCHLMFAYRIMLISRSKIIAGLIGILALCSSASSFVFGGKLFGAESLVDAITSSSSTYLACGLWNGFAAACDVLIAAFLTFYLSRMPTGFRKTDLLINRIICLTIETGILTAASSIATVVLFVGFHKHPEISVFFVLPLVVLAKMYPITILAAFNNRPHTGGIPPTVADTDINFFMGTKTGASRGNVGAGREIQVGRTVVRQVCADDIPMSHVEMLKTDPESLSDDTESMARSMGMPSQC